jgi:Trp operon repressor
MKYLITKLILDFSQSIEISQEEFHRTKQAKANLITVLGLEEKLDLLLENFVDYERELLNLTLHTLLFRGFDWSSMRLDVQAISRRFTNYLATGRLYLDQARHDISQLYGRNSHEFDLLCHAISNEYDQIFEYRVMEALRNYVQHKSLPLQSLRYGSEWEESSESAMLRYSIAPGLNIDQLRSDPDFKSSVRLELSNRTQLLVTPLVRKYMEAIGHIHETIHKMTSSDVEKWDSIIGDVKNRAKINFNEDTVFLVVAVNENDELIEEIQIFQDLIRHRKLLTRKNHSLTKLSHRYVTGAVFPGTS